MTAWPNKSFSLFVLISIYFQIGQRGGGGGSGGGKHTHMGKKGDMPPGSDQGNSDSQGGQK